MLHTSFSYWCHFQQCPWDLHSALAERVGQGEVGGFEHWAQVTWPPLGLAIESSWSALGGPFLSYFARTGLENGLLAMCRASIFGSEVIFLLCRGDHWPRAVTIASSLGSGCDLSHECAQDGCNGTCVKLEASKPTWSGNVVHLGDPRLKVTSREKNSAINTRHSTPFSCEYLPSLEHCFFAAIHSRTRPRNFINSLEVCRAVSIACLHIVQVVEVANQESLGKIPLVEWLCHWFMHRL